METVYRIPANDMVRATRAFELGDTETLESLRRPSSVEFDAELAKRLIGHVLEQGWSESACDAWLAPRIHAILRFPRRVASDRGVWFWLATTVFKPYVQWRFERKKEKSPWWRYNGELLRNAASRLWWGAEMVRSEPLRVLRRLR